MSPSFSLASFQVFAVVMFRGDHDYLSNYLGLPHFNSLRPCLWCQANAFDDPMDDRMTAGETPLPWSDFSAGALWRRTLWIDKPLAAWQSASPSRHILFYLPGVSAITVCPDQLHIADLGVFGRVIANTLFAVVYDQIENGATLAERLANFWVRIVQAYDPGKRQLDGISLSMFCDESKPHRKQPKLSQVKGAECRYLLPAVRRAFAELVGADAADNPEHGLMLECLEGAEAYLVAVSQCDAVVPPPPVSQHMKASIDRMLRAYAALSYRAIEGDRKRWGLVPKHHFMAHLGIFCKFMNPRLSWTYGDEDFMSVIKRLVEANSHGTPPHKVGKKIFTKWLVAWDLRADLLLVP